MKPSFPIRYKFLAVTSALLAFCVAAYLGLAASTLKKDKTALVYDLNKSFVTNLSSDLDSKFRSISDKLELYALTNVDRGGTLTAAIQSLLGRSSDIAYIQLVEEQVQSRPIRHVNKNFLRTYGLSEDDFSRLPAPLKTIREKGEALWNAGVEGQADLIGYGRSVIHEDRQGTPLSRYMVIAYISADQIAKSLDQTQLSETFIANGEGELLVHSKTGHSLPEESSKDWPLVNQAMQSPVKTSVFNYEADGEKWLGAFAKSFGGRLIVGAKVREKQAFAVVQRLTLRSVAFALIVLTLSFIAAVFFSRSITRPLDNLMGGMDRVAEGDLTTRIEVHSRDEIRALALSFNAMISDLKESRDQLEQINRDLENKVKERTRQLEEQNQAVKAAQEALLRTTRLAAVGEIAGRAAHEVLNPLTSILSRLESVKKKIEQKGAEGRELLGEICTAWQEDYARGGLDRLLKQWQEPSEFDSGMTLLEEDMQNLRYVYEVWQKEQQEVSEDAAFLLSEGQRINRIVSNMRTLSRVRGNKELYSVHDLLHECVNIMADLFNQHGIVLDERFCTEDLLCHVDKDEFIQSATNLLRNSLQAVAAAGIASGRVVIHTFAEGGRIGILIEDNGEGIAQENHEKLFEKQFTTKEKEEGTGLGLSISRRFIRAVGGDIRLHESVPGERTVFEITLPLANEEAGEEAVA